jgi:hypothetical protein
MNTSPKIYQFIEMLGGFLQELPYVGTLGICWPDSVFASSVR